MEKNCGDAGEKGETRGNERRDNWGNREIYKGSRLTVVVGLVGNKETETVINVDNNFGIFALKDVLEDFPLFYLFISIIFMK